MFKKLSSLVVLCLLAASVQAAETPALKIGVINVPEILKSSSDMQKMNETLRTQFEPRQKKIVELQKSLTEKETKLKRDATIMSQSERVALQDDIAAMQRDLRRQQEDFMQDARAEEKKTMDTILTRVNSAVQDIAEKEHYDLILQRSTVAFASQRADLTQEVLKKLNAKKQG